LIKKYENEISLLKKQLTLAEMSSVKERGLRIRLEEDIRRMLLKNMTSMNVEAIVALKQPLYETDVEATDQEIYYLNQQLEQQDRETAQATEYRALARSQQNNFNNMDLFGPFGIPPLASDNTTTTSQQYYQQQQMYNQQQQQQQQQHYQQQQQQQQMYNQQQQHYQQQQENRDSNIVTSSYENLLTAAADTDTAAVAAAATGSILNWSVGSSSSSSSTVGGVTDTRLSDTGGSTSSGSSEIYPRSRVPAPLTQSLSHTTTSSSQPLTGSTGPSSPIVMINNKIKTMKTALHHHHQQQQQQQQQQGVGSEQTQTTSFSSTAATATAGTTRRSVKPMIATSKSQSQK
jgi:hypothetical protein